jgi:hypothetical protein
MFELICLQKKPGFMLPYVIFHMITNVIAVVAVVGISILLFFSNVLIGLIVLVVGGLFVGKKCACMYTHTYICIYI